MFGYFLSLDSLVSYNVSPEQHPDKVVTVMAKHSYDKRFGKRLAMSVTGGESENDRMPLSFLFFLSCGIPSPPLKGVGARSLASQLCTLPSQ